MVVHRLLRWFRWRYGQELLRPQPLYHLQIVVLLRFQSSDFVDECLHHLCLSLSLGLSLSPLLSCHVRGSRRTIQRQLRNMLNGDVQSESIACVVDTSDSARQADMDDMGGTKRSKQT